MNRNQVLERYKKNNAEMQRIMGDIQKNLSELSSEYKKLLYDVTSINSIKHKLKLVDKLLDDAVSLKKEENRLSEKLSARGNKFVLPLIKNGKVSI
jgi:hypothetical protein